MVKTLEQMRKDALEIFSASIAAADPENAVRRFLVKKGNDLHVSGKKFCLDEYQRVVVVGAGKASAAMAKAVEGILGDRIDQGLVVVKYGHTVPLSRIKIREASHPIPDKEGLDGAKEIVEILKQCSEKDMVISLISGGGSALLPLPADGISLEEKQEVTKLLIGCGASIHEINTVRKHLSLTKGGSLSRLAYPATVINLMLSDVVGDDMDVIASGPFVPDKSTFDDAMSVLEKYGLLSCIPVGVLNYLQKGVRGDVAETPKPGDHIFENMHNVIVGSNSIACEASRDRAISLGYNALILSSAIEGNTEEAALSHAEMALKVSRSGKPIKPPACIVSGGETTVKIKGNGLGGRNQEFALLCAKHIAGKKEDIVILSAGTDGTDGPTDAAGGIIDPLTEKRGKDKGLDINKSLRNNDSYHYLDATGDLLKTGPTRTNVMDIHLVMIG
jgi:hydroxypyruvate reductase